MTNQEFRLAGTGGQGLMLSARILAEALGRTGKTVAQSQHYEPTSRGGLSQADIVVSDAATIDYPLATQLDYAVILDDLAFESVIEISHSATRVLVDSTEVKQSTSQCDLIGLPFTDIARDLGNPRIANLVALGALVKIFSELDLNAMSAVLADLISAKFLDLNLAAINAGYEVLERADIN